LVRANKRASAARAARSSTHRVELVKANSRKSLARGAPASSETQKLVKRGEKKKGEDVSEA
jgi:hypothetical protein